MIEFKTNNRESQIAIEVADRIDIEQVKLLHAQLYTVIGIFNKSKSEIDFVVKKEWVSKTPPLTTEMFVGFNDYTEENLYCDTKEESYISFLQSVTKDSEHNKFVILKIL